jgi:hypothetical protein
LVTDRWWACSAVKEGFSGYNVDWEPASGVPTADDAKRYAHFLTEFAEVRLRCICALGAHAQAHPECVWSCACTCAVCSWFFIVQALHAAGKELTVDFAGWSTIWDYESLNASKADRLLCMVPDP